MNKANKKYVKVHYKKSIYPGVFSEGDLELVYDQVKDALGTCKFDPMWHGPYIVRHVLGKGAYELEGYEENILNELYIKRYYA
jgi:hypothetical protein